MHIKWTKQAHGFHQATYPNKNYKLFADLVTTRTVDGQPREWTVRLGGVIVQEDGFGRLTFLFGSQVPFWPGVHAKLRELDLTPEQMKKINDHLSRTVPATNRPPRAFGAKPAG